MKLKFDEFAGHNVGKCLYEPALGSGRRLNVKARFTRSFLAQRLGLRVCYRYFESDDKQLYRTKMKYIEETDPESLGLVFAEEEYDMLQGGKTFCASLCASLIAGSRRAFLCVDFHACSLRFSALKRYAGALREDG
ncbi:unnamed protein product [Porites lobata]|uniref:Uncharacterized protein n=1 Tax=Porites lobata TaxID=104759 RepID=A0ABN8PP55_9CNID|nr:unnamed protein product [Porites lobata]